MPTPQSSLYDPNANYVTMNYCSDYLSEGMLERLDGWSEYEEFQIGCFELIKVFSAWENSKGIRENPKLWSELKDPKQFNLKQHQKLEQVTNSVDKLNNLISNLKWETERNWKVIGRDSYFTTEEN